ncbi:MAG: hypothetical protein QM657_01415 [Lacrimispora sp.]|uniref:anti-sigma-I factor RsgI family protein n=1 Tax=Lacrimispora sp. TaxID=2719234 RepID=UPI0039E33690
MAKLDRRQLNRQQLEACIRSAVCELTPDVLDRIDLNTPQEKEAAARPVRTPQGGLSLPAGQIHLNVRRKVTGILAAACLSMIALAGGTYTYQNGKVDSVIGIDVNPSVELSVNKRNKVLEAEALNDDGIAIMEDMDLKGVDLNVAVNAVIGSMVTQGYLNDLDNAILVTVSNDSIKKAQGLRYAVVKDIQATLEEKQLKAVVYDQQVIEEDEVKQLADEYKISYGKAYFLKELISQNSSLTLEDMKELAPLTMEEIARVITERSYAVGDKTGVQEPETLPPTTQAQTSPETSPPSTEASVPETLPAATESQTAAQTSQPQTQPSTLAPSQTPEETSSGQEVVSSEVIKIDYVDYENELVMVYFKTKVKWKNPTVSVKDGDGNTYSAKMGDTSSDYCEIHVTGLQGATEYTFILGGISPKIGRQTTVKGVFETPVIGDGMPDSGTEEETEETSDTEPASTTATAPSESKEKETKKEETTHTGEEPSR